MSNTKEITKKRIEKEKETLEGLDPKVYKVNLAENSGIVEVEINPGKDHGHYSFNILLGDMYPFREPLIKLNLLPNQSTLVNTEDPKPLDMFFKKPWTPNVTWKIIILYVHRYMASHIKTKKEAEENTIFNMFEDLCQKRLKKAALLIVLMISVLYRVLCSFGGYSGINDPPNYGDYEAQRHWMELTVNLHPLEWYIATPENDLTYWRIDYPPLSAYLSYIFGLLSRSLDPLSMELFKSRGYETPAHKLFMRGTVLVCDILVFITAILVLTIKTNKKYNFQTRLVYLFLILLTPLLILIDHGHFQYNCATLGLALWGVYFCGTGHIWLGSVFFTLALNVKQMALYFAIPFFFFILGTLYRSANLHLKGHAEKPAVKWFQFILQTAQVGTFVIGTMALLWWPWTSSLDSLLDVVHAIFPVKRGLYQLKVASFWCATEVVIKWQRLFSPEILVLLSMGLTLAASAPSAITLFRMPRLKYLKIALFNVSMAFFFFSYHVHEKTILLPLLPFIINVRYFKHFYVDFILVTTFTNYHMLVEDKLTLQYYVILLTYAYFAYPLVNRLKEGWQKLEKQEQVEKSLFKSLIGIIETLYTRFFSKAIILLMIILTICDKLITPPAKYPFLFHLLFALVGFGQFMIVFIYSNLKMVESFTKDKAKENEALSFNTKEGIGKND